MTGWVTRLACGHEAQLRHELPVGGYLTCLDGRCQGQRRVVGVRPAPAAYVAPAARVLTFLHRPDPDREADLFSQPERIDGYTACGLPFAESELWMPVEARAGDRVCPACVRGRPGADVQEALL